MSNQSCKALKSTGRDFLDLYKLGQKNGRLIEDIIISAKQKTFAVDHILKLIKIKKLGGAYGDALVKIIDFIENEDELNNFLNLSLFACSANQSVALHKCMNELGGNDKFRLVGFIHKLLDINFKSCSHQNYVDQTRKAIAILGMLNAIELFPDIKSKYKEKNAYEDTLIADIVFNKAFDDARVMKSAVSFSANFSTIVFGYDVKNEINGNSIVDLNNVLYAVSENIRNKYAKFHVRLKEWADKYRLQQIFYAGYLFGMMNAFIKDSLPKKLVIYTHDMHSIHIGEWLKAQFSSGNIETVWFHDFHEYVEGVEFASPDRLNYFLESEKYSVRKVDHSVTVSPGLAHLLSKNYSLNPIVVYNSFNADKRAENKRHKSIKEYFNIPSSHPLVIYSGGVTKQRRVGLPLKALVDIPDLIYCIITNSSIDNNTELAEIFEKAKTLGVDGRIKLHPYVEAEYAWELMVGATACLSMLPRYPNGDIALPNKLFDAIKAQTPFFTSDNPELKEFVTKNKCGATFKADDETSFSIELKKLIVSPHLIDRVDYDNYSWDHGFSKVAQLINKKKDKVLRGMINVKSNDSVILMKEVFLQDPKLWEFYRIDGFFDDLYPRHNSKVYDGHYVAHPMHGAYLINRLVAYAAKTKNEIYFDLAHRLAKSSSERMESFKGALCFFYNPDDGVNKYTYKFYSGLTQCRYIDALIRLNSSRPRQESIELLHKIALSMTISTNDGGVLLTNDYGTFIEEYPSAIPKYVLNGWLTSLNILIKYSQLYEELYIQDICKRSTETLSSVLSKFDLPDRLNSAYSLTSPAYIEIFSENKEDFEILSIEIKSGSTSYSSSLNDKTTKKDPIFVFPRNNHQSRKSYRGVIRLNIEVCAIDDESEAEIFIKVSFRNYSKIYLKSFDPVYAIKTYYPISQLESEVKVFSFIAESNGIIELKALLDRKIIHRWGKKPVPFGKKIGGVYYNVYHFIHINALGELLHSHNDNVIRYWRDKWLDYTLKWDTCEIFKDEKNISLKPYYPIKMY
ncbi:MAG: hypothetical protein K9K86_11045 [Pseudomonadales bacterium]|nr:hypothetical protein [Pseudomonadales bacterium]